MAEKNMPDYDTIQAAVAGKAWAVKKVLDCYSGELDKLATVEKKQPDGSMKKEIDADMRQTLVLKLIEAIPQFLSAWRNGKRSV
ncbi:helix-turn-helix domain-containing protein [Proteiniborus sp. MB09-C3]|uniref:helix-turn-helix domain-containing protein n=1 Tax=Proteiniborus sp. MB09-C3 TaxID=3050072 RepID=UPI0025554077|nr:helix-turn-helix domain-containing protein [Proteiniborus sp. MB09-C3]WIV13763.1 helix-turn-helix domain-containing protein [Proteiniborus sp. MB09-C3]